MVWSFHPRLGLYDAGQFRLTDGHCGDCAAPRQALWYFEQETIAAPLPGLPSPAIQPGLRAADDVRAWTATLPDGDPGTAASGYPPLVWVAAPHVAAGARLAAAAATVEFADGSTAAMTLHPRIALNRSWFDATSAAFFAPRTTRLRGTFAAGTFTVRTPWPEDFRLDPAAPIDALDAAAPPPLALRALTRALPRGGAEGPFAAHRLWQRPAAATSAGTGPAGQGDPAAPIPAGRAVLGFIVNGAQGDDDEAHGGHFALVTGRTRADGAIGDWLVNNFYSLDVESEKGILAAPVPLDNYLADLNSGQGWYRPSYMLVAVLADDRAAALVQGALNRVYNQFYRHQLAYRHGTMNCAGISVDVLRALGWNVPARGATSRLAAVLGFPYFLASGRSVEKAKTAFDYMYEDQTRLLPEAAFEMAGADLLGLAGAVAREWPPRGDGALARMLAADVEAIAFLRFPQFPSSRSFGTAAAATTWEYRALVPSDPAEAQIVPVPARPFPAALRDPDLLPVPRRASDIAAVAWCLVAFGGLPWLAWRLWRRFTGR